MMNDTQKYIVAQVQSLCGCKNKIVLLQLRM